MTDHSAIPLQPLFDAAVKARQRAYCPYSRFPVGAALYLDNGAIVAGANVENAAFPLSQCAEASAIGAMITEHGAHRVKAVVVIGGEPDDPDRLCTPCGGCRQRLAEFATPDTPVHLCGPEGVRRTMPIGELLPYGFQLPAN